MSNRITRVLGIDTSLRSTGIAVVEACGNTLTSIEYGVIKTSAGLSLARSLRLIYEAIDNIIERSKPVEAAIEGAFYSKNVKTSMLLGAARGSAITACACRDLPVFEYAPRKVKQAVVGFGGAGKEQVGKMVMTLLGIDQKLAEDESDALAIAICHLHNRTGHAVLAPKEV